MATDVDQICYEWPHEELDVQDDSREITVSQMLDHGSISFGRFDLEPLSWERRSVFTRNRYQEELQKFRAPGLVAQKKAYFEEYYKRIRSMKALEENEHTKAASNCDDISGISGQIKEDRSVVTSEKDGVERISTIGTVVEKALTGVTLDVNGEIALVELDSLATFSKDNKNGKSPPNLKQRQILDINSYHDEPIKTDFVNTERHDFIRVDKKLEPQGIISESISQQFRVENQRVIRKKSRGDEFDYVIGSDREKASIEAPLGIDVETDSHLKFSEYNKMGENTQNSKQFQFLVQNSGDHEPITASIDDSKQPDFISQDNEVIMKKTEKYVPNNAFYTSSLPKVFEDKSSAYQKKVNQAVKGGFKGKMFSSEVMQGHSSTARDLMKSKLQTKSVNVARTQVLRDSSQKRNGKSNVCIAPHKQTIDQILGSKHATVVSHGSKKEMHSTFTTPCPFPSVTGKQAVASISASARYVTKSKLSSSSLSFMNINSKGVSSRPGMPYSQKREKLKNKRALEPRSQPLVTNRQATHLNGISATNMIRLLKERSVNLPAICKGDSNVGTNSNRIIKNNEDGKRKLIEVANDERCLKEVRAHGKSTIFPVLSRNPNPGNVKMAPSRSRDLSVNVKSSQLGDNSLGRRKPRQEKPRWR